MGLTCSQGVVKGVMHSNLSNSVIFSRQLEVIQADSQRFAAWLHYPPHWYEPWKG